MNKDDLSVCVSKIPLSVRSRNAIIRALLGTGRMKTNGCLIRTMSVDRFLLKIADGEIEINGIGEESRKEIYNLYNLTPS